MLHNQVEPTQEQDMNATSYNSSGGRLVSTEGQELPLQSTSVQVEASGGIARIILEQVFFNHEEHPLQVSYMLPLPVEGAVSGFSFTCKDRTVVGEVDRKADARERFEQAILDGKMAALLEQKRENQFQQEVGNIPPQSELVCEIQIDQKLLWLPEGSWEWRFPTVIGNRYMGTAGRVKDAEALLIQVSEQPLKARSSLALKVHDLLQAGGKVSSPSHPIQDKVREAYTEITFLQGARLDRDIVIRWPVATPEVGANIRLDRPASEKHPEGFAYGLLTLIPPQPEAKVEILRRDLIFLIDASGSMSGLPFQRSIELVCTMIDSLHEQDRLEILSFNWKVKRWYKTPTLATREGKQAAKKWVRARNPSGGTEMREGISEALRPLDEDSQRQIVLITDGYIGFEQEILAEIHSSLPKRSTLHTIGVGSAPNRALTRSAAREGRGLEILIGLDENVAGAAKRLLDRTVAPLLSSIEIKGEALIESVPAKIPDVYKGAPLLAGLKVRAEGGTIVVSGKMAGQTYRQDIHVAPTTLGEGNQSATALFGREKLADLESQRAFAMNTARLEAQIEDIGLTFQLASSMTSWVAIDEHMTAAKGQRRIKKEMPHEQVYGTSVQGMGLRPASPVVMQYAGNWSSTCFVPVFDDSDETCMSMPMSMGARSSSSAFLFIILIILFLIGAGAAWFFLQVPPEAPKKDNPTKIHKTLPKGKSQPGSK